MPLRSLIDKWDAGDKKLFLFHSDQADNAGHCNSLDCVLNPGKEEGLNVRQFAIPAALKSMDSLIFSLGPTGQGLPLHAHGASWQSLVHGKKFWVFFPPGPLGHSSLKVAHPGQVGTSAKDVVKLFHTGALSGPKPYFCLQEPGETIVHPHQWAVATMNVGDAVAIGG